jgi:hypothetical protein
MRFIAMRRNGDGRLFSVALRGVSKIVFAEEVYA